MNLDGEHDGDNGRARRPSGGTVLSQSQSAISFALWCDSIGIHDPSQVDARTFEDYAAAVSGLGRSASYPERCLKDLMSVAVAGNRVFGDAVPVPPWEHEGIDAYIVRQRGMRGENRREPLAQNVIAPLLCWALRFVNDFSEDILAAQASRERIQSREAQSQGTSEGTERLRAYFQSIRDSRGLVPSFVDRSTRRRVIAGKFIAGFTGSTSRNVSYCWRTQFKDLALGAPAQVHTEISGRIGGEVWRGPICFEEVPRLTTILHTACLIVVGYLTGMRTAEILNLRRGCCKQFVEADGRTVFAITGHQFKHVREGGLAAPGGRVREQPWYAVAPVARAIEIVEQIHSEDYLWPAKPPWSPGGAPTPGRPTMSATTAGFRFADFVNVVRDMAHQHGREHEVIPDTGPITFGAFRRTLAWFIVWQPGGDLAAGLQYGHLEPLVTTQGYSGRSRSRLGLGDVINMERLRRVVDTLAEAADGLDRGERVSGPASDRYLSRVAQFRAVFEGRILGERQMTQLRQMPELRIYESRTQYLTCVMDPLKALCLTGSPSASAAATPDVTRCNSRCGNGVRTDTHADQMRTEAERLRAVAESPAIPEPLRLRHEQRAAHLDAQADSHDQNAREV